MKQFILKIENVYAFTKDLNDELVTPFNNQSFTKVSAILRIKCYNPGDITLQHIPLQEKVRKVEVKRMRIGYITDTLISVDIQELAKTGWKVIKIYEGIIHF